jgi:hypothetical protein
MADDQLRAQGLWAWLDAHPDAIGRRRIKELSVEAQQEAWADFMAGKSEDAGIGLRFSPRGWDALGLTHRGAKYEARKAKKMGGRNLPYVSPNNGPHMRDLLKVRGAGYNVASGRDAAGPGGVRTTLTLPGARGTLNRIAKAQGAIYRREFLQLQERARHQGTAILNEAVKLFMSKLLAEIETAQARSLV